MVDNYQIFRDHFQLYTDKERWDALCYAKTAGPCDLDLLLEGLGLHSYSTVRLS